MIRKINKTIASAGKNRGAGIVTVLVAMTFVAILGSILLYMSYANTIMKVSEQKGVQNFVEAAEVLDLIRSEMQISASQAVADAQQHIIENFDTIHTDDRDVEFKAEFLKGIGTYSVDVDESNVIALAVESKDKVIEAIENLFLPTASKTETYSSTYEEDFIIQTLVNAGLGEKRDDWATDGDKRTIDIDDVTITVKIGTPTLTVTKNRVVVSDINVTFKNNAIDYTSEVSSDIVLNAPTFSDGSAGVYIGDVQDYAIISDGDLINSSATSDTTISANSKVVAENIYIGYDKTGDIKMGSQGFKLQNGAYLMATDQLVVGTSLEDVKKTDANEASSVYAQDIKIVSDGTATINGNAYVADDLVLDGNGSTANIKSTANYYGIGNSTTEPEESSAIIVNGYNTTLNIDGASTDLSKDGEIIIAGRSFVGPVGNSTSSAMMGESLSLRSNQLSYLLIPGQIDNNIALGITANPMIFDDTYIDSQTIRDGLTEATFQLDEIPDGQAVPPELEGINTGKVKTIFYKIPGTTQTAVYFFVEYDSEEKINKYIEYYYSTNKQKIDEYIDQYTTTFISGDSDLQSSGVYFNAFSDKPNEIALDHNPIESQSKMDVLLKQFTNITHTLSTNKAPRDYSEGTPMIEHQYTPNSADPNSKIYDKPVIATDSPYSVVMKHEITAGRAIFNGVETDVNVKAEIPSLFIYSQPGLTDDEKEYVISNADYKNADGKTVAILRNYTAHTITKDYIDKNPDLAIVIGGMGTEITVENGANFNGLIITGGDVILNGGTINAAPAKVQIAAAGATSDTAPAKFKELSSLLEFVVPMGEDAGKEASPWDYDYIVQYENWNKN